MFSTISIGTPGLTIPIFMNSLPRSMDITANDATINTGLIVTVIHTLN